MDRLHLKDLDLNGKRLLMRVDFNVPLDPEGNITDDTRIRASLPSIQLAMEKGARLILMSHLGRPKGAVDPKLSLRCCADRLSTLIDKKVSFSTDCVGPEVESQIADMKSGDVLLLENLRFHGGETKPENFPEFPQALARLGDCYVNDAFGTAHRRHTSTVLLAELFPEKAACGYLLEKEIEFLGSKLSLPEQPFYAIIGGSKVSSKIGILESLLEKVQGLFVGGGLAFTFLKAKGLSIGNSLLESDFLETAEHLLRLCDERNIPIHLPQDVGIVQEFSNDAPSRFVSTAEGVPKGWMGLDIGPETLNKWKHALRNAKTVLWNGPMGVFEFPNFAKGTCHLAQFLASLPATVIVGGGDSIAALRQTGCIDQVSHASTGGGAALEYIEKGELPGIQALSKKRLSV